MNQKPESSKSVPAWEGRSWAPQGDRLFIGTSPVPGGARLKSAPAEESLTLERELLLADGAADPRESPRPASARRSGWLVALALVLIVGALAAVAFLREQQLWQDARTALEGRIAQLTAESSQKIAALQRDAAARETEIGERKAAHQSLTQLADKTLAQLQACLADLRQERERNQKLEADYQVALKTARPTLKEALAELFPPWVRAITPERVKAIEAKEKAAE